MYGTELCDYTAAARGNELRNAITISNPHPSLYEGLATTHAFSVDTPLPTLDIPLAHGDTFALDFDNVYRTTYETLSAYSLRADYAQLPAHFETYSPDDQARIRVRMAAVELSQAGQ